MIRDFRCVGCQTVFQLGGLDGKPDYCPNCGNPRNEQFGLSAAATNPNITGFEEL